MKNAIWTIMKKELARFFGDRRLMLTTVLLPGMMIFLLYRFTGIAIQSQMDEKKESTMNIQVAQMPESIHSVFAETDVKMKDISEKEVPKAKELIRKKKLDLCLIFPENFDSDVNNYEVTSGEEAPLIQVYYNSTANSSLGAYENVVALIDGYEEILCNKFDINIDGQDYDLASEKDEAASMFASMLPALIMMFLFSGCVSVAPESIAGEKERGTIATLLVTPIRRGDIALGKIGALSVIAILSAFSSVLGTVLSLPQMMQNNNETDAQVQANVYHISDYLLLALVILVTVFIIVTLISILSTYARTIKEAQTLATPLMLLVMMVGLTAMFSDEAKTGWEFYLIPLYNSVQCMVEIFSFKVVLLHILLTVLSDLAVTGIGVWILTRMFRQERIMFS